jgi:flagellar protein FlbT
MPLSIPLPARAKIIINGAVLENTGTANITLTVHNKANILRDKDVVTEAEADTPAKEIYHAIQNAYLFEANREEWLKIARLLLDGFAVRQPEAAPLVGHVLELLADDKIYNALRASRRLIAPVAADAVPARGQATVPGDEKSQVRGTEIGKIKDQIAALERRIEALGHG